MIESRRGRFVLRYFAIGLLKRKPHSLWRGVHPSRTKWFIDKVSFGPIYFNNSARNMGCVTGDCWDHVREMQANASLSSSRPLGVVASRRGCPSHHIPARCPQQDSRNKPNPNSFTYYVYTHLVPALSTQWCLGNSSDKDLEIRTLNVSMFSRNVTNVHLTKSCSYIVDVCNKYSTSVCLVTPSLL